MRDHNYELLSLFIKNSEGQIIPLTWHEALLLNSVGASGLFSVIRISNQTGTFWNYLPLFPFWDCSTDERQQWSSGVATWLLRSSRNVKDKFCPKGPTTNSWIWKMSQKLKHHPSHKPSGYLSIPTYLNPALYRPFSFGFSHSMCTDLPPFPSSWPPVSWRTMVWARSLEVAGLRGINSAAFDHRFPLLQNASVAGCWWLLLLWFSGFDAAVCSRINGRATWA